MIDDHLTAWDRDYSARGNLFGGTPSRLPNLAAGTLVLELGCGNGKSLHAMETKGWSVVAVDYASRALRMCRERFCSAPDFRLVRADARNLPFRDNTFDVSFATHIAGHLLAEERIALAEEITRVTKPGGALYFRDFGTGDFRCGKGTLIEDRTFRRGSGSITHYFSDEEVRDLFSGFRRISVSRECWSMRVRGRDYRREEVTGIFEK
jgi:ubiquinone/menaquinone biosynthesis C-methylase UbiE